MITKRWYRPNRDGQIRNQRDEHIISQRSHLRSTYVDTVHLECPNRYERHTHDPGCEFSRRSTNIWKISHRINHPRRESSVTASDDDSESSSTNGRILCNCPQSESVFSSKGFARERFSCLSKTVERVTH